MIITVGQARDEMYGAVKSILVAQYSTVLRKWEGIDSHTPPSPDVSYTYSVLRHATGFQAALAGADGRRRWRSVGTLTTQCFVPLSKTGAVEAMNIATALQIGIQGLETTGNIWFRNTVAREVGETDAWFQANFSATFEYDRIQ